MVRFLWLVWRFLSHRWTRYIAAWIAALAIAGWQQHLAQRAFRDRDPDPDYCRADGNDGHTSIDFAGQWLMGRMLVTGHGRSLYDRNVQLEVAHAAFPRELERRVQTGHDAENLVLSWFVDGEPRGDEGRKEEINRGINTRASPALLLGAADPWQAAATLALCREELWSPDQLAEASKKRIGGPLYPPIQAFLFAPLALGDHPQWAYRVVQWIMIGMAFVCGGGVSVLTRGRIWCPVGAVLIMFYPGFQGAHALGQNPAISLALLVWGWALLSRERPAAAGIMWGLLAFKPVWALAFLLAPVLTRRWRMVLAMCVTGALVALATVPFVGFEVWLDWLKVGKAAAATYDVDPNWITLSRDLLSIPRRFLVPFEDDYWKRDRWYIALAGWTLLVLVFELLVRLTRLCRPQTRAVYGPAAAFVLLGAWLMGYHFMYYDALLSALGFIALLHNPAQFLRPLPIVLPANAGSPLTEAMREFLRPRLPRTHPDLASGGAPASAGVWVANSFILYALLALIAIQNWFTYFGLEATVRLRINPATTVLRNGTEWTVEEAKLNTEGGVTRAELATRTITRVPQFEISTFQAGPAWDTWCLLGVWLWAGACTTRQWMRGPVENVR